jgi:hypothetical protein
MTPRKTNSPGWAGAECERRLLMGALSCLVGGAERDEVPAAGCGGDLVVVPGYFTVMVVTAERRT